MLNTNNEKDTHSTESTKDILCFVLIDLLKWKRRKDKKIHFEQLLGQNCSTKQICSKVWWSRARWSEGTWERIVYPSIHALNFTDTCHTPQQSQRGLWEPQGSSRSGYASWTLGSRHNSVKIFPPHSIFLSLVSNYSSLASNSSDAHWQIGQSLLSTG